MSLDDVRKYYARYDEWGRLERPAGRLEFERSVGYFERFMPSPCRVLDLGCGPGRYAIALAMRGHQVTLADLSSAQLDIARQKITEAHVMNKVDGIHELSATSMPCFNDESFDAVVAFGPFYHLISQGDRQKTAREIARVVRPGGWVFVAFMPPFFQLTHLITRAVSDPEQVCKENFIECFELGLYKNRHDSGFQEAYFAYPAEIRETLAREGLHCRLIASLRGIANEHEADLYQIAERDPDLFKTIMEVVERSSEMPSVIDMAGHAIAVAQKNV